MLHIMGNEEGKFPAEGGYLAINQEIANVLHSPGIQAGREEARAALCAEARQRVAVRAPRGAGVPAAGTAPGAGGAQGAAGSGPAAGRGATPPAEPTSGCFIKDGNFGLLDQWNTIEVIWQGDGAAHLVNGRTVNVATRLQHPEPAKSRAVHPACAREDRDRDRIRGDLVQTD